jgi:hypothetical protein
MLIISTHWPKTLVIDTVKLLNFLKESNVGKVRKLSYMCSCSVPEGIAGWKSKCEEFLENVTKIKHKK